MEKFTNLNCLFGLNGIFLVISSLPLTLSDVCWHPEVTGESDLEEDLALLEDSDGGW
jgi:hypothetical protein